jgi:peptidoglycan/xylan/chitin deacetylase (PgdA/CDA1 family)/glycosyltransferase involved in cell wall biosynthesis
MRLPFLTPLADGKISVLLFHKVPETRHRLSPSELEISGFEQVLDAVMENFRILPLSEAVVALGKGRLPAKTACITFDDGYPEWIQYVVPVLERRNAHATFFVTSGQFDNLPMWNERILSAVDRCAPDVQPLDLTEFGVPKLPLQTLQERQTAVRLLDGVIKYLPPARKEAALQKLELHAGPCGGVSSMTVKDLLQLHARGFAIGAHSITHPILTKCSDEEAYQEIAGSREILEGILGEPVKLFAYPNGIPGKDFGLGHIEMVRKAGYTSAFSTNSGVATQATSHFQIPRFTPWGPSSAKMRLQMARNLLQTSNRMKEVAQPVNRTLMVAFHFPPQAGSSGVQRTLNFAKQLPNGGWLPTILTAHPRAYESVSNDLLESIPASVSVKRVFALDASRHFSVNGKYISAMALPDRWSSWWFGAVVVGLKEIRRRRPEVLWSTYPIATAHLIGATLHRLTGIPWIADFRDPMLTDSYPAGRLQRQIWSGIEASAIRLAAHCTFTTQRTVDLYTTRYPEFKNKFSVIANGYDEDAFKGNSPAREGVGSNKRLLLHSGVIYPRERDPLPFFMALSELIAEGALLRSELCVRFRAPKHGDEILAAAQEAGLQDIVEIKPAIPYRQAIGEMLGADLLLLFQGEGFDAQIPAKLYEYFRAGRPILAMTGKLGDTRKMLNDVSCARNAIIHDRDSIKFELKKYFETASSIDRWTDGEPPEWVYLHSRSYGAQKLNSLMDSICIRSTSNF